MDGREEIVHYISGNFMLNWLCHSWSLLVLHYLCIMNHGVMLDYGLTTACVISVIASLNILYL